MGVYIEDNMVVIGKPKTFYFNFNLSKFIDKNVKDAIEFIIKRNESLAEHTIKNEIRNYCSNISMETIFMNTEIRKTSKTQKFIPNLSQKLDLKSSNRHVALDNLSIDNSTKKINSKY